jgi:hypothetical protein
VRFDDRLRTVLAQPASVPHDRAVRWRQLVELTARAPADGDRELLASAIADIRDQASDIEERVRIAAALAVAWLPLSVDLVAAFAADRLTVAAPVLSSARLTASEWRSVAASASDDCRGFIASLRSEQPHEPQPPRDLESPGSIPSISDVVARIERLRNSREEAPGPAATGQEQARLFRWECNESGEIDWVEGIPRGALVGQSIAQSGTAGVVDRSVERAFQSRAPFHDGVLELPDDAAVGGSWRISGVPAFERSTGRFAGYRGVAERPDLGRSAAALAADPDSLRELAHEIKTPLNAIIGFAEIITGEYLGPAGSRYRERASEIVAQARLLLGAIEDLDFAAKIHSSNGAAKARTDIGALVETLADAIRQVASERGIEIEASRATGNLDAAIQAEVAERLVLRMCSAVVARASHGEKLRLTVDSNGDRVIVAIGRPQSMAGMCDNALFGTASDAMSPGFPLRLARGLAQTAGASLVADDRGISLLFPRG